MLYSSLTTTLRPVLKYLFMVNSISVWLELTICTQSLIVESWSTVEHQIRVTLTSKDHIFTRKYDIRVKVDYSDK